MTDEARADFEDQLANAEPAEFPILIAELMDLGGEQLEAIADALAARGHRKAAAQARAEATLARSEWDAVLRAANIQPEGAPPCAND